MVNYKYAVNESYYTADEAVNFLKALKNMEDGKKAIAFSESIEPKKFWDHSGYYIMMTKDQKPKYYQFSIGRNWRESNNISMFGNVDFEEIQSMLIRYGFVPSSVKVIEEKVTKAKTVKKPTSKKEEPKTRRSARLIAQKAKLPEITKRVTRSQTKKENEKNNKKTVKSRK